MQFMWKPLGLCRHIRRKKNSHPNYSVFHIFFDYVPVGECKGIFKGK